MTKFQTKLQSDYKECRLKALKQVALKELYCQTQETINGIIFAARHIRKHMSEAEVFHKSHCSRFGGLKYF